MTNKEYIIKSNEMMINAYLLKDYNRMDMWRILLNTLIDEELKNKEKRYETKGSK
jgi:hypothetical protein